MAGEQPPPWFLGSLSREAAEEIMVNAKAPEGSFFVRDRPESPGEFILVLMFRGKPTHHLIKPDANGTWTINSKDLGGKKSMKELVELLMKPGVPNWPVVLSNPITIAAPQSAAPTVVKDIPPSPSPPAHVGAQPLNTNAAAAAEPSPASLAAPTQPRATSVTAETVGTGGNRASSVLEKGSSGTGGDAVSRSDGSAPLPSHSSPARSAVYEDPLPATPSSPGPAATDNNNNINFNNNNNNTTTTTSTTAGPSGAVARGSGVVGPEMVQLAVADGAGKEAPKYGPGSQWTLEDDASSPSYLFGPISRLEAEAMLEGPEGTFLFRERPENQVDYVLSVVFRGKPSHHLVRPTPTGALQVNAQLYPSATTLPQLVAALNASPMWPVKLQHPVTNTATSTDTPDFRDAKAYEAAGGSPANAGSTNRVSFSETVTTFPSSPAAATTATTATPILRGNTAGSPAATPNNVAIPVVVNNAPSTTTATSAAAATPTATGTPAQLHYSQVRNAPGSASVDSTVRYSSISNASSPPSSRPVSARLHEGEEDAFWTVDDDAISTASGAGSGTPGRGAQSPLPPGAGEAAMVISGRQGFASGINGIYIRHTATTPDGRPTFRLPPASPKMRDLFMYFHAANRAWAIAEEVSSSRIVGYNPEASALPCMVRAPWRITDPQGRFLDDPRVSCTLSTGGGRVSKFRLALQRQREVCISKQSVAEEMMVELCAELRSMQCSIVQLKLYSNGLSLSALRMLTSALLANRSVTHLQIRDNGVNDESAALIASLIAGNACIQFLSLRENTIGDDGTMRIAQALRVNTSLTCLSMWSNEMTELGVGQLVDSLKFNTSLKALRICQNLVGSSAMRRLLLRAHQHSSCIIETAAPRAPRSSASSSSRPASFLKF